MQAVELKHAYRLLNHGPTVLVGSCHAGRANVMAASWALPPHFDTPKLAVATGQVTLARQLIESSARA